MKFSIFRLPCAAVLLLMAAAHPLPGQTEEAPRALPESMITLLASSGSKTAQHVQVSGYLILDFEGEALYLHREDYQAGLTRNAIRLSLTPDQMKQYAAMAGAYVTVEGAFQKRRASEDIFTGSLFDIRSIRKTISHR